MRHPAVKGRNYTHSPATAHWRIQDQLFKGPAKEKPRDATPFWFLMNEANSYVTGNHHKGFCFWLEKL